MVRATLRFLDGDIFVYLLPLVLVTQSCPTDFIISIAFSALQKNFEQIRACYQLGPQVGIPKSRYDFPSAIKAASGRKRPAAGDLASVA